ncbi:MAG: O-antigen ligase family protein [Patescibacteria group bacterium]|jgi:O-antigen ligase
MKYLNKTIEYGLYLLVFLLPIQTRWIIKAGEINGGYSEYATYSLYATDILLIIVLLLFIVCEIASPGSSPGLKALAMTDESLPQYLSASWSKGFFGNSKIAWWLIGGLILTSAVSVFFALNKPLALYKFGWLMLGAGLFWLIINVNYNRLKLIYAMLAGIFLQAVLGIWQFLIQSSFAGKWLGMALHNAADLGTSVIEALGADGVSERWLRAYGGLDHPNIFGGVMATGALFSIGQIIKTEKEKNLKIISWIFLGIFSAGLFFSFSRSAWLGLAVGLLIMIISVIASRNLKLQRGLAEVILVMGILLFILFGQYQNLITSRLSGEGRLEEKSTSERLVSYQESWQLIKNNWLAGAGLGNYTLALSQGINPGKAGYYYQPAHNVFMLVWAEAGIFGLIFFSGLIIWALARLFRFSAQSVGSSRDGNKAAILIALFIIMSFDHWFFSLHFGVLFFWLILGVIIADGKYEKSSADLNSAAPAAARGNNQAKR